MTGVRGRAAWTRAVARRRAAVRCKPRWDGVGPQREGQGVASAMPGVSGMLHADMGKIGRFRRCWQPQRHRAKRRPAGMPEDRRGSMPLGRAQRRLANSAILACAWAAGA
jgi:hypothetical protein